MTKILVPLADGLEEVEAITIIDILRRGGADVVTAGLTAKTIHGSHDILIQADELIENLTIETFEGIVLPGGMPGTLNLKKNKYVLRALQKLNEQGKLIAAICAAPMVLYEAGILYGTTFTMHPGVEDDIPLTPKNEQVVEYGNIITGQASGAATFFALRLVEKLFGKEKMEAVNQGVLFKFN